MIISALALFPGATSWAQCPERTGKNPEWGVYQILWRSQAYPQQLRQTFSRLGGKPRFVLFFRDLKRGFPVELARAFPDLVFIPSMELAHWGDEKDEYLPRILNGEYDDFFRRFARDAQASGRTVYLRFGFEMTGTWFGWGRRPEEFRRAWIRAHDLFREEGAHRVKWVFSPNVLYDSLTRAEGYRPYYPGDAYVDHVALDGYNFGDRHDRWHRWESFTEKFSASIDSLCVFGKPLFIAEVGSADDARKAQWMRDFLAAVDADRRIHAFVYFNYDKRREGEPNWALDSDPETLRVFRAWAAKAARGSALTGEGMPSRKRVRLRGDGKSPSASPPPANVEE